MKIYVGNLPYDMTEQDLRQEFEAFGGVDSVNVIVDRQSGRSKGFAFIEMVSKSEAEAAITGLSGKTIKDRTLVVNESRPRIDSRGGSSYGDRRGSSYDGGRGGGLGRRRQRRY